MMYRTRVLLLTLFTLFSLHLPAAEKQLAYIVSDLRIPYWNIMWNGVQWRAAELGYGVKVYSAENIAKQELQNTVQAIREQVDGIVLSPTNSSAAVTVLKLAHKAQIPVVIADIGTQGGDYVSMIESDNQSGAYQLGKILVEELQARGWSDGRVGIIAIPQRRKNGKLRTSGFLQALEEGGIKTAELYQQEDFSYAETRGFARQLIADNPDLRALWLQGSDRYQGALDAIREAGKEGQILLICFDAEPEFIEMIQQRQLVGAGMQQPFLMGEQAVESLHLHLQGNPQPQRQKLEVLAVSADNIDSLLSLIRRNVLGQSESNH